MNENPLAEEGRDDGPPSKYFHMMLNMDDDDLDPYEYRLLGHYRRRGKCTEGMRKIADTCRMSIGQVSEVRDRLVAKGYLEVTHRLNTSDLVVVKDRMAENVNRYAKCSPGEQGGVHGVNGGVHGVNIIRSSIKNNPVPSSTEKAKKPRPRNLVFDAIALGSYNLENVTPKAGKKIGTIVSEVCALEFGEIAPTPQQKAALAADLKAMYSWYKSHYPHLSAPGGAVTICKYLREWRELNGQKKGQGMFL